MSNGSKIAVAAAAALLLLPVLLAATAGGALHAILGGNDSANATWSCTATGIPAGIAGYQPDQITNAATIAAVGNQMQVPEQGIVIAIATAMQESGLRNLNYGDRDSLGLFQQRPSQGWGTPTQITNPTYAATQFYRHLLAIPNWQNMTLNDAAQTVQHSATPNAYGQHEVPARILATTLAGATCTPPATPSLGRPGGGPEAVHQEVAQATGLGFMLGPGGHGEDADEGGGDVVGGDVAAQVTRRAAGVENRGDGRQ
jgi:hypothetical protein